MSDGLHCCYAILLQVFLGYLRPAKRTDSIGIEQPVNLIAIVSFLLCNCFFLFAGGQFSTFINTRTLLLDRRGSQLSKQNGRLSLGVRLWQRCLAIGMIGAGVGLAQNRVILDA